MLCFQPAGTRSGRPGEGFHPAQTREDVSKFCFRLCLQCLWTIQWQPPHWAGAPETGLRVSHLDRSSGDTQSCPVPATHCLCMALQLAFNDKHTQLETWSPTALASGKCSAVTRGWWCCSGCRCGTFPPLQGFLEDLTPESRIETWKHSWQAERINLHLVPWGMCPGRKGSEKKKTTQEPRRQERRYWARQSGNERCREVLARFRHWSWQESDQKVLKGRWAEQWTESTAKEAPWRRPASERWGD